MAHAKELHVLLMGIPVAVVRQGGGGRLSFDYSPEWQASDGAQSVSLSLPWTQAHHTHRPVLSYMSGLLPDSQAILDGWGATFGVSSRNPFALLAHMGEDCAGAAQFVREERLDIVLRAPGRIEPLTGKDIADALNRIRRNAPPWRAADGTSGMFSLAGAQAKLALARVGDGWGRPEGKAASTHIIKPPSIAQFPGIEVNEHVCLNLARHLGIPAAASCVERFGGEAAIVVERFDRVVDSTGVRRLHQEDTCQALGIPPTGKYQRDGGPGFVEMAELARLHSADPEADLGLIVDAAAFNWLIGGTDGHAKNYSWFITAGDRIRVTPLYDLVSALPYYDSENEDLRLAMSIGGENRFLRVRQNEWSAFAEALGADPNDVVTHVRQLAELLPTTLETVVADAIDEGLDAGVLMTLKAELTTHAERCAALV